MGTHPIFESDFDCLTEYAMFADSAHLVLFSTMGKLSRRSSIFGTLFIFCVFTFYFPLYQLKRKLLFRSRPVSTGERIAHEIQNSHRTFYFSILVVRFVFSRVVLNLIGQWGPSMLSFLQRSAEKFSKRMASPGNKRFEHSFIPTVSCGPVTRSQTRMLDEKQERNRMDIDKREYLSQLSLRHISEPTHSPRDENNRPVLRKYGLKKYYSLNLNRKYA